MYRTGAVRKDNTTKTTYNSKLKKVKTKCLKCGGLGREVTLTEANSSPGRAYTVQGLKTVLGMRVCSRSLTMDFPAWKMGN